MNVFPLRDSIGCFIFYLFNCFDCKIGVEEGNIIKGQRFVSARRRSTLRSVICLANDFIIQFIGSTLDMAGSDEEGHLSSVLSQWLLAWRIKQTSGEASENAMMMISRARRTDGRRAAVALVSTRPDRCCDHYHISAPMVLATLTQSHLSTTMVLLAQALGKWCLCCHHATAIWLHVHILPVVFSVR